MEEKTKEKVPIPQKLLLTIEEAAAYSNIGIGRLRALLNDPRCPFVLCVGNRKKLIKRKEFEKFISHTLEL